ncbi:MAG TPA: sulfur carrier protein ThiS [Verrucomicrobiae bacterium]|nr:sulfur carrier protein ThiS [Verrucomicrobiae bacterium]
MERNAITIVANGKEERLDAPCSVAGFIEARGWKATQIVVERNGSVLAREQLRTVMLADGDQLEVIVPVAGG